MNCGYCSREAESTCTWLVPQPIWITVDQVVVGDRVHVRWMDQLNRLQNSKAVPGKYGCSLTEVVSVLHQQTQSVIWIPGRILVVSNPSRLKVSRPAPCGVPCCDLHRREPDDGVVYCANHWITVEAPRDLAQVGGVR